jgi:hypothetical protein
MLSDPPTCVSRFRAYKGQFEITGHHEKKVEKRTAEENSAAPTFEVDLDHCISTTGDAMAK